MRTILFLGLLQTFLSIYAVYYPLPPITHTQQKQQQQQQKRITNNFLG